MMFAEFDPANLSENIPCGSMLLLSYGLPGMEPIAEIQSYKGRVLLIHGTEDRLVHPKYSRRAYEAYVASCPGSMAAEEWVQLRLIEGGGHGFNEEQVRRASGIFGSLRKIWHFEGRMIRKKSIFAPALLAQYAGFLRGPWPLNWGIQGGCSM